jgi:hypothetical protein
MSWKKKGSDEWISDKGPQIMVMKDGRHKKPQYSAIIYEEGYSSQGRVLAEEEKFKSNAVKAAQKYVDAYPDGQMDFDSKLLIDSDCDHESTRVSTDAGQVYCNDCGRLVG